MRTPMTSMDLMTVLAELRAELGLRLIQTSRTTSAHTAWTLGPWVFVAAHWPALAPSRQYALLLHEAEHVRQYRRMGLGSAWLGIVPFLLCYALLPLPVGLAWCRYRWERAAYFQQMCAEVETQGSAALWQKRAWYVRTLTGPAYWHAWPFPGLVSDWVDAAISVAILQAGKGKTP